MTSTKKRIKALNLLRDLAGESSATYDAVTTLQEALCDAAQLDGMREADRLRGRAVLEAWSGSLSGLDEAAQLSAKAEALAALSIAAPTAEEQRDAAFAKVASLTAERNQLRASLAEAESKLIVIRHALTLAGASRLGDDGLPMELEQRIAKLGPRAEAAHLRAIVDTLSRLALDASTPRAQLDCVIVELREQAGLPRSV